MPKPVAWTSSPCIPQPIQAASPSAPFRIEADSERDFIIQAADGDKKLPTFSMTAYTGGAMKPGGFYTPVVVDLSSTSITAKSIPILRQHDPDRIVGHTTDVEITEKRIRLTGTLSGVGEDAQAVAGLAKNGYPWQASIGAQPGQLDYIDKGESVKVNGRNFSGPIYVARKVQLYEVSFVTLGADSNTSATVAAALLHSASPSKGPIMGFEAWLQAKGFDPATLSAAQRTSLLAAYDAEADVALQAAAKAAAETETDEETVEDPVIVARRAMTDEFKRQNAIKAVGLQCKGQDELVAKAIEDGWEINAAKAAIFEAAHKAKIESRPTTPGHSAPSPSLEAGALECALLTSCGTRSEFLTEHYDEKTLEAAHRNRRGAGLQELFYVVLEAAGKPHRRGHMDNETIRAAFEAELTLKAAGFSNVSVSGILSNVANKVALAAYTAVESVVSSICEEVDAKDFKKFNSYRLTGSGEFEEVGQDGELKHATLGEDQFENKVGTRGRIIALTREAIINDDLGVFLGIPKWLGRQSALSREKAVFKALLGAGSFFSSGNKNYIEGAATNLSLDALGQLEALFLQQTDSNGQPILVSPRILLVPTALKGLAEDIFKFQQLNETTTANKGKINGNRFAGRFTTLASPYLDAQGLASQSSTAFYLLADPNDVAAIQVAYLQGRREPTIETGEVSFSQLGISYRGYFDFGVSLQDHRAAAKSKGAA